MQRVIFVMGATAAGKSYFIEQNHAWENALVLNVYDYQQRVYEEEGFAESVPINIQFRCLRRANMLLLKDIIEKLEDGCHTIVVEQTFYKAKRRIAYIDEIRKRFDVTIEVYVICPSDALWESNLQKRDLGGLDRYKKIAEDIEVPNVSEGIDAVFEVVDKEIRLRMAPPKPEILELARKELAEEDERIRLEDEAKRKQLELLESMKERRFWHYCEVCGRKEFITANEAFDDGWDYPPNIGHFGILSPRTCGNCLMKDTLFWKINMGGGLPIVREVELSPEELETWRRIKGEPESLL